MTNILSVPSVSERNEIDFIFNTPLSNYILVPVRENWQFDMDAIDMESEERPL